MKKFLQKICYILAFGVMSIPGLLFTQTTLPFADVPPDSPYYESVKDLYNAKIISNDGNNLFEPNKPMNRDFFVSLAVQIGCKECLSPDIEDIITYNNSPFVDLTKTNPFYYCIAHAEEEHITYGYTLDNNGTVSCENGESYTSSPFCAQNSINKIEAVAMLLRRANLWNDKLNQGSFDKNDIISDVSNYWYSYAKKGLEIGLLTKDEKNNIYPDHKITRGEFALMASKILEYTQCNNKTNDYSYDSYIITKDKDGKTTDKIIFEEGEKFSLIPNTTYKNPTYSWKITNQNGKKISKTGPELPGNELPPGKWFIELDVEDENGKIISNSSTTITINPKNKEDDSDKDEVKNKDDQCIHIAGPRENFGCPHGTKKSHNIGISITGTPTVTHIGNPITFTPHINGIPQNNPIHYNWNFGDGNRKTTPGTQIHSYDKPGTYSVTLVITDPDTGDTATSKITITITDDTDSDGDGILDKDDKCPKIKGTSNNAGCPNIAIHNYGCSIRDAYNGKGGCTHNTLDSDGDGVLNTNDKCPFVPGLKNNFGCPKEGDNDSDKDGVKNKDDRCMYIAGSRENFGCPQNDTDKDGVIDALDKCKTIAGLPEWNGCPQPNLYRNITPNICLSNKINSQGLITGVPNCNTCPCISEINITSTLRECDVVFPTILSPNKDLIYSRGNFYLIQ